MIRIFLIVFFVLPTLAFASEGGEGPGISTLIFSIINFIIFVCLLYFVLRKPVKEAISNRASDIEKAMADAAAAKEEAEAKLKEVTQKLEALAEEAGNLKKEMEADSSAEKDRLIAQAEDAAKRISEQVQVTASQELLKAKAALRKEAAALAVELAEKLIKDSITDDDRKRLVDEYLKEVEQV